MNENNIVIYHNARCSKSRAACELLAGRGLEARIVNYLETPPTREELRALLGKLGLSASRLLRRGEAVFKEKYAGQSLDEAACFEALLADPILIERPIVVRGGRAVIGRPTEKVAEFLDASD